MHIKQVIVEGFKTYREQTVVDFDDGLNCIVGANGSGKSNLFHAIRFVLSDVFGTLRAEERQRLLHEGAGHAVMSAYVEIVFDNADGRLPVEREEVRLRRNIGLKKDEYYLDKKHVTRAEVVNLLESAGFSRTNPYYVVQQGKIMKMATMQDEERLDLLKEIGGTSVFEAKRKESLKGLDETKSKREQVQETVEFIEGRLAELDDEKDELQKYTDLDKTRRSLEYTIYEQDLSDTRNKLDEIERQRSTANESSRADDDMLATLNENLKRREKEVKEGTRAAAQLKKELTVSEQELREIVARRTTAELDVKDLRETIQTHEEALAGIAGQKVDVEKATAETEKKLADVREKYNAEVSIEEDKDREIAEIDRRAQSLYQKQGRSDRFKTTAERDAWLKGQIKEADNTLKQKKSEVHTLENDLKEIRATQSNDETDRAGMEAELIAEEEKLAEFESKYKKAMSERNEAQNERKELQRKDNEVDNSLASCEEEVKKRDKQLEFSMPRDLQRGMAAVQRIVKEHNIEGVHGPLIELMQTDERFHSAIEASAGNQLFHIVVDHDDTASRVIEYLNKEKGGRVTFLPLNRMAPPNITYPEGSDAFPLVSKLKYEEKFDSAFKQVFARVLICRNIDVAVAKAGSSHLNCVTMDGDTVSSKGTMSGGYHDTTRSRIAAMTALRELNINREELRATSADVKKSLQAAEQKMSTVLGDISRFESQRRHATQHVDRLKSELRFYGDTGSRASSLLEQTEKSIAAARVDIERLEMTIADMKGEIGSSLDSTLSPEETSELEGITARLTSLKQEKDEIAARRLDVYTQMSDLQTALDNNLQRRAKQIALTSGELDINSVRADLAKLESHLKSVQNDEAIARKSYDGIADKLRTAQSTVETATNDINKLRQSQEEMGVSFGEREKQMETLISKSSTLSQKREGLQKKIRELGSLPSDAFERYRGESAASLRKLLDKANKQLSKLGNVNKKALDQYQQFTEQREELEKRRTEINKAYDSITQLIDHLDHKKDEAIERTFKQVSMNFKDVFHRLVPGGRGELVMQRKRAAPRDADEDEDAPAAPPATTFSDKYSGVKIKVSFGQGETMQMKQLSGGQKTVVAVALIFAIQRCDPMPFYLFDEIDAALDPQYRTAVAHMVKAQANNKTQFIATTFRPEIVKEATCIQGVSHSHKVSTVQKVPLDEALNFVGDDTQQQMTPSERGPPTP